MQLNPYISVIIAAIIGGSSGVFIKSLSLSPTVLAFFRTGIPVIILTVYFLINKTKIFHGNYKLMFVASSINAIRILFYMVGFLYTSIANAAIILFTWPIFATIFGVIILKEKISKRTILLIAMAFLGIIIMYSNQGLELGSKDFIGMGAVLISAILFSLTAIIFKKELKQYTPTETVFYQNLVGAIIFLPFIIFSKNFPTIRELGLGTTYGFMIGIVAYILFFYALKRMKMSHYSLMVYFEVPAAVLFGIIFFNEVPTVQMIFGGILIILAGLLLKKEKDNKEASKK